MLETEMRRNVIAYRIEKSRKSLELYVVETLLCQQSKSFLRNLEDSLTLELCCAYPDAGTEADHLEVFRGVAQIVRGTVGDRQ